MANEHNCATETGTEECTTFLKRIDEFYFLHQFLQPFLVLLSADKYNNTSNSEWTALSSNLEDYGVHYNIVEKSVINSEENRVYKQ